MGQLTEWIVYNGKKILICDFANFNEAQYLAGVDAMEKELLTQPRGSKPLLIVDVTNSSMTGATSARGKKTVAMLTAAGIATVTAMVGITGIKKVIAQAISRDVHFAADMQAAKDYVTTH